MALWHVQRKTLSWISQQSSSNGWCIVCKSSLFDNLKQKNAKINIYILFSDYNYDNLRCDPIPNETSRNKRKNVFIANSQNTKKYIFKIGVLFCKETFTNYMNKIEERVEYFIF